MRNWRISVLEAAPLSSYWILLKFIEKNVKREGSHAGGMYAGGSQAGGPHG